MDKYSIDYLSKTLDAIKQWTPEASINISTLTISKSLCIDIIIGFVLLLLSIFVYLLLNSNAFAFPVNTGTS